MGYSKTIISGNNLERTDYEKDVISLGRSTGNRKTTPATENMGTSGKDTLSERDSATTLGKRRDNAQRSSVAFRRIVASNLGGLTRPLLVTLTYRDNFTDLKGSYKHFSSFIQSLRYKFGKDFKYISVPEFQKRGAVHFHALFWGLPEGIFLQERKTRTLAELWARGFVYLKETDGNEKLSFYLSKYMAKAFIDPRLKNQKCYVASRNIQRPTVIVGASPLWVILEDYGITDEPLIDREYPTKYLGKGRYRLFKIPK
ncbi:MAG: hypothetical protein WCI76_00215 [bacterium]